MNFSVINATPVLFLLLYFRESDIYDIFCKVFTFDCIFGEATRHFNERLKYHEGRYTTILTSKQTNRVKQSIKQSIFEIDVSAVFSNSFNNNILQNSRSNTCEAKLFFFECTREITSFTTFPLNLSVFIEFIATLCIILISTFILYELNNF